MYFNVSCFIGKEKKWLKEQQKQIFCVIILVQKNFKLGRGPKGISLGGKYCKCTCRKFTVYQTGTVFLKSGSGSVWCLGRRFLSIRLIWSTTWNMLGSNKINFRKLFWNKIAIIVTNVKFGLLVLVLTFGMFVLC